MSVGRAFFFSKNHSDVPVQDCSFWPALWQARMGADDENQQEKVRRHRGFPYCLLSHNKGQSQQLNSLNSVNSTSPVRVEWTSTPVSLSCWCSNAGTKVHCWNALTNGKFLFQLLLKIIAEVAWDCYRIRLTLSEFIFPEGKEKTQKNTKHQSNKTTAQLKYILAFPLLLWLLLQTRFSTWH